MSRLDQEYNDIVNQEKILNLKKQKWQQAKFLEWQKDAFATRMKFLNWFDDLQYVNSKDLPCKSDSFEMISFTTRNQPLTITIWKFNVQQTKALLQEPISNLLDLANAKNVEKVFPSSGLDMYRHITDNQQRWKSSDHVQDRRIASFLVQIGKTINWYCSPNYDMYCSMKSEYPFPYYDKDAAQHFDFHSKINMLEGIHILKNIMNSHFVFEDSDAKNEFDTNEEFDMNHKVITIAKSDIKNFYYKENGGPLTFLVSNGLYYLVTSEYCKVGYHLFGVEYYDTDFNNLPLSKSRSATIK
jgi:hypothetical protein